MIGYCSWCRRYANLKKKIWMGEFIRLCGHCIPVYEKSKKHLKAAKIKAGTDYVRRQGTGM